jgi:hypothetical protein
MSLTELQNYVQTYNRAVFTLIASGRAAPSKARLERFEESIDFSFPEEFRQLSLSPLGGLCFGVPEELWPRPPADTTETWHRLFSIKVFGIAAGVPRWLDLREELNSLPIVESDIVPFMARGSEPQRYCFDLDGQIVRWSPEDGGREIIEQNFFSLLLNEFADLEARWERYKAERSKKPRSKKTTTKKKKSLAMRDSSGFSSLF